MLVYIFIFITAIDTPRNFFDILYLQKNSDYSKVSRVMSPI